MYSTILTVHIIVCLLVVLIVLVQSGKGAGLSGLFGGGGGDALFSAPSGSSFMRKLTTGLATAFFLTCIMLTYLAARRGLRTVTRGPWSQGQPLPLQAGQSQIPGLPAGVKDVKVTETSNVQQKAPPAKPAKGQ